MEVAQEASKALLEQALLQEGPRKHVLSSGISEPPIPPPDYPPEDWGGLIGESGAVGEAKEDMETACQESFV